MLLQQLFLQCTTLYMVKRLKNFISATLTVQRFFSLSLGVQYSYSSAYRISWAKVLEIQKKCKRTKYMWCWWHDVDDNERISERTNQLDDDNDNDNSIVQFRIIFLFRAFFSVGDKREKLFLWAIFPHRSMRFRSLRIALSSLFVFFLLNCTWCVMGLRAHVSANASGMHATRHALLRYWQFSLMIYISCCSFVFLKRNFRLKVAIECQSE